MQKLQQQKSKNGQPARSHYIFLCPFLVAELAMDDDFTEVLFRLMMISILFCKPLKQGGIKV